MKEPSGPELRLADIVLAAAERDGAEREKYLQSLIATEPDLAAEVRRRIAAAEELSNSFLETPAVARLGTEAEAEPAAPPVAALPADERYELGECLGEGGMGRVLKAFDRQLGRTVALKFLTVENPELLRLFLSEARAQARIRHDHVLDIYDSGELNGQPFIAMQYVAGGTLAQVAAELPLEGKVRLLIQAAEGLHAAHREGLLHCDVKPSNILVDRTADGELRALVTDFGIAIDLGGASASAAETVAGTPQYIAPERLAGQAASGAPVMVDRRSDIYSFGMTMYRLLAGALPFTGRNTMEILNQVLRHDLPAPRTLSPSLPAELESVILRCIAPQPEQRYTSARAVARDLERYLNGEVVEAFTAGLAYRLTRFVLRRKLLVGMAAVAVAALAISSVAVAVFAWRADTARQRAELRQGQAEELIRFMVVDLRQKLEALGRLDILHDAGGAAATYFAAVPAGEFSEDELLRRSRMLYQIGDVRIQEGDLAGAAAPMAESLALARRLVELRPDDGERLFELGQAYFWVGFVAWEQGDLATARSPFEEYLAIAQQLADKDPANLDWRQELSHAHSNLGSLLEAEGDLGGALKQFLTTLAIDGELVALDPTNEARFELAAAHNTAGTVLESLGRLEEAETHLRSNLEILHALVEENPADFRSLRLYGTSLSQLGVHLFMRGRLEAAGETFERAEAIFTELMNRDPANTDWRYQLAWSHLERGRVAFARGQLGAADGAWRSAQRMVEDLLALDATPHKWRRTQAVSLYCRALLQMSQNRASARGNALQAVQILEALAKERPTDRSVHRWLSQSYLLLGHLAASPADAEAAFGKALKAIEPFVPGSSDGRVLAPWATALSCLGRNDEAGPVLARLQAQGYAEPGLADLCR